MIQFQLTGNQNKVHYKKYKAEKILEKVKID